MRILLAAILLMASTFASAAELEHALLFDSGRDGYPRYRIPSLIVTPSGTVLAICEGRKDGRGLTGNIDLVFRTSKDSGKTWSPVRLLADDGDNTLGNPCAVVDTSTKDVWVAFTRSKGNDTEEEIVEGKSDERTRVFVTRTKNDGDEWSKPVEISSTARRPEWTWYGTGPGIGIQIKSGRLVVPSYHAEERTRIYRSHMVYSDDHGATWKHGDSVGEHASECHVVETKTGDLVLNARTTEGPERRTVARSTDGGTSWSKSQHDEQLYDSHCEACLIVFPGDKDQPSKWLFTHPAGPGRRNLTARVSHDEGKTWPESRELRSGDSQYSCLAKLPDGSAGCLYESWVNGNYRLYFVRFDAVLGK